MGNERFIFVYFRLSFPTYSLLKPNKMEKKNVMVCMMCFQVYVNGVYQFNTDSITMLLLTANYTPEKLIIVRYICYNCRKFISPEDCTKLLKENESSLS